MHIERSETGKKAGGEMSELKPCPFCGGEAKITGHFNGGTGNSWEIVTCTQCGVAQPTTKYYSREQAISAWNRRAAPENKPLTLEELHGRIGKPIFIVDGNIRTWTILECITSDFAKFTESSKCSVGLPIEGLNKVWFPYARESVSE